MMSFTGKTYLSRLQKFAKDNNEQYTKAVKNYNFGELMSRKEIEALSDIDLATLYVEIRNAVTIEESPYDIWKLTYAIQQNSQSVGASNFTAYQCKFCGELSEWGSTITPDMCLQCAKEIAENMILKNLDIVKG